MAWIPKQILPCQLVGCHVKTETLQQTVSSWLTSNTPIKIIAELAWLMPHCTSFFRFDLFSLGSLDSCAFPLLRGWSSAGAAWPFASLVVALADFGRFLPFASTASPKTALIWDTSLASKHFQEVLTNHTLTLVNPIEIKHIVTGPTAQFPSLCSL